MLIAGITSDVASAQKLNHSNLQRNTMITKNGILRPSKNSSLITNSSKTKISKVNATESNASEPEVDFTNIPTIQGTYKAVKLNNTVDRLSRNDTTTTIRGNVTRTIVKPTNELATIEALKKEDVRNATLEHMKNKPGKTRGSMGTIVTKSPNPPISDDNHDDGPLKGYNPALESSPWKPIVPHFINADLSLPAKDEELVIVSDKVKLKEEKIMETAAAKKNISSSSTTTVRPTTTTTTLAEPTTRNSTDDESRIPSMLSKFDALDVDFPHDRLAPEETVNIRVNGKFKNKITNEPIHSSERPNIETLDDDHSEKTYDLRLKASTGGTSQQHTIEPPPPPLQVATEVPSAIPTNNSLNSSASIVAKVEKVMEAPLLSPFLQVPISTRAVNATTTEATAAATNSPVFPYYEDHLAVTGIGEAVPVFDQEGDLEARNRYTEIKADEESTVAVGKEKPTVDKKALLDAKRHQQQQQPVYTSYRTPDLNGVYRPSLVENPNTLKPFRHTLPVNKIDVVIGEESEKKAGNSDDNGPVIVATSSSDNNNGTTRGDADSVDDKTELGSKNTTAGSIEPHQTMKNQTIKEIESESQTSPTEVVVVEPSTQQPEIEPVRPTDEGMGY